MKLKNYKKCKNMFSQIRGLMFSKKKTLVFYFDEFEKISLHMLFVFFPIDVWFLDKHKKIVEIKKRFLPFTFYTSNKKAKYIVEIPSSKNKKVKLGTKIEF